MDRYDTLLLGGGSPESRGLIRSVLEEKYNLLEAGNVRQLLLLLEQNIGCIASVLLDVTRPEVLDGQLLRSREAAQLLSRSPVIVITEDDSPEMLDSCFALGASDVIPLDYEPYSMLRRIETIVQLHLHRQNLEQMVEEQARILRHSNNIMVDALSSIIEYRSMESGQHILRIRQFTRVLLEQVSRVCPEYGLTEDQISIICSAAALHDVGKIGIPDAILMKPGPLTPDEREIMKTHTYIGCQILESLGDLGDREYLRYAHNICHYHHERWDGGGYPEGRAGEDIPICAQVVGLTDVYDALTTRRVYKEAYDLQVAANMIFNGECGVFSPKLLECFKQVLPRFEALNRAYADGLSPGTEKFETELPSPAVSEDRESLNVVNGKYLSLLHYINAFVLELSVDQGYFHLRYNPYPELGIISRASNFAELEAIILEQIIAPEDRQRMTHLIRHGIEKYLQAGMRRQSFRFSFRTRDGSTAPYDVTLLRANVNQTQNRSLAVLCRRAAESPANRSGDGSGQTVSANMVGATFCCRNDRDLTLVRLAPGVHTIAGYSWQELQEQQEGKLITLVHPEDRAALWITCREQLSRGTSVKAEFRCRRNGADPVWAMFEGQLVQETDGLEVLYCYMTDISNTRQAYEELKKKIARYEIILAQTENVLFDWNVAEDTISFSDTWNTLFGSIPVYDRIRQRLTEGALFHPDDLPLLLDAIRRIERGSDYEMLEVRTATNAGRYMWCRIRASALRDETGRLDRIVGLVINIDTDKQAEQALQDRAERDALTKLLNKAAGQRQAEEYLGQFPDGVSCALMIIDLDNFKQVNDSYGHLFGDSVLTRAAKEIRKLFRAQDIVARIGGDEFMVLMRGTSDRNLVENRCQRLRRVFGAVFHEAGRLPISCSIGVALAPEHGTTYVELFRRADQALYRAKGQGRNTYIFSDGMDPGYLYQSGRMTAVSNRIDSDDHPVLADVGIVQYAFQQLYTARDMDASIQALLELIGRQTNVSRVYVFENSPDNRLCSNTYEWCNAGISPEKDHLQNVSYETDIPGYDRHFDGNGIFYCPDIRTLPSNVRSILEKQGIRSVLQCAILEQGVFRGYIGFDDCRDYRLWTREQIDLLTYFSEMLSVFLLKMRSQERVERRAENLSNVLDSQNAWIYIVDPDTFQLKYLNDRLRRAARGSASEQLCYRRLEGRDTPCPGCPFREMQGQDHYARVTRKGDRLVLAEANRIQWERENACMLTWRDLPEENS